MYHFCTILFYLSWNLISLIPVKLLNKAAGVSNSTPVSTVAEKSKVHANDKVSAEEAAGMAAVAAANLAHANKKESADKAVSAAVAAKK